MNFPGNFSRQFLITGSNGAFGSALKKALEERGGQVVGVHFGTDWTYSDYSGLQDRLKKTDVLVLAHGSKKDEAMTANCTSWIAIITLYRRLRLEAGRPAEIWGLGSEIEIHPAWGIKDLVPYLESKRAFARYAAKLYRDPSLAAPRGMALATARGGSLIYRHIVPSAFRSRMGFGLMSAGTAVRIALFFLKHDWRYIPVTYTGLAVLNYHRFRRLGT